MQLGSTCNRCSGVRQSRHVCCTLAKHVNNVRLASQLHPNRACPRPVLHWVVQAFATPCMQQTRILVLHHRQRFTYNASIQTSSTCTFQMPGAALRAGTCTDITACKTLAASQVHTQLTETTKHALALCRAGLFMHAALEAAWSALAPHATAGCKGSCHACAPHRLACAQMQQLAQGSLPVEMGCVRHKFACARCPISGLLKTSVCPCTTSTCRGAVSAAPHMSDHNRGKSAAPQGKKQR